MPVCVAASCWLLAQSANYLITPLCLAFLSGVEHTFSSYISHRARKPLAVSVYHQPFPATFNMPETLLQNYSSVSFDEAKDTGRNSKRLKTDPAELHSQDGRKDIVASYQHEPLPTREHTRVLILGPGPNDDNMSPLVGSLRLLDLCDADSEPFEAISYVWGPPARTHVVLVDGHPLPITASLRGALLQTRLPDRPRTIWADAICINQWDHNEKGHQVGLMGRIYKTSKRTLVCLGVQDPEHAQNAAGLIEEVELMIQSVQRDPNFSGEPGSFPCPAEKDIILRDPRWQLGWDVMGSHPWFRRGWVVQEVVLGPDACILWASVQIRWISILRLNHWFVYRALPVYRSQNREIPLVLCAHHSCSFARRHPEEAGLFDRTLQNSRLPSTLTTLFEAWYLELSDPRDRIYAFMALDTSDAIMADLQLDPDYNRPYLEIYHDFAVKYINNSGDLDILSFTRHTKESLASAVSPDLSAMLGPIPSWVPRWDLERTLPSPHRTKLPSQPKTFKFTEKCCVLRVRGLILGSVEYLATQELCYQHDYRRPDIVLRLWREVVAASSMNEGPYHGRQAFAFFDVLHPISHFPSFEEWSSSRQEFAQFLQSNIPGKERSSHHASLSLAVSILIEEIHMRGPRRFVILSQGYYGVAPPVTQKGDLFALIYGCETLSILRPIEGRPGHYQIVGPVNVESKTVSDPYGSNMMGKKGCRDWEEWGLTEEDINLC